MRSKNAAPIRADESRHMAAVKELPCGVCSEPGPSEAHHIKQGLHFTVIPLCHDCHRGSFNGIHGQRRIWAALRLDELAVLNQTICELLERK